MKHQTFSNNYKRQHRHHGIGFNNQALYIIGFIIIVGVLITLTMSSQIHDAYSTINQIQINTFNNFLQFKFANININNKIQELKKKSQPNVVLLSYINWHSTNKGAAEKRKRFFCDSVRINSKFNIHPKYLGLEATKWERSCIMKLNAVFNELQNIINKINSTNNSSNNSYFYNNTIIMFIDGFDATFQTSLNNIISKFISLNITNKVLFNAEKGCSIGLREDWENYDKICDINTPNNLYPIIPNKFQNNTGSMRYLNTGVWISYIKPAYNLFKNLIDYSKNHGKGTHGLLGDQDIGNRLYIGNDFINRSNLMILDFDAKIINGLHDMTDKMIWNKTKLMWYNPETKHYPMILHYNGNGKDRLHQFIEKNMESIIINNISNTTKINGNYQLITSIGNKTYKEMCNEYPQYYF